MYCISEELHKVKPPKCNIAKPLKQAIRALRNDDSIVTLPADKGKATVVLDKTEYIR